MDRKSIEVNFRAALAKADELEEIADELERALKGDFEESMSRLSGNWTGDNADFFQTKGVKLAEQIGEMVRRIRKGATEVRQTANVIYKAEMAALAIAEMRIY